MTDWAIVTDHGTKYSLRDRPRHEVFAALQIQGLDRAVVACSAAEQCGRRGRAEDRKGISRRGSFGAISDRQ